MKPRAHWFVQLYIRHRSRQEFEKPLFNEWMPTSSCSSAEFKVVNSPPWSFVSREKPIIFGSLPQLNQCSGVTHWLGEEPNFPADGAAHRLPPAKWGINQLA